MHQMVGKIVHAKTVDQVTNLKGAVPEMKQSYNTPFFKLNLE